MIVGGAVVGRGLSSPVVAGCPSMHGVPSLSVTRFPIPTGYRHIDEVFSLMFCGGERGEGRGVVEGEVPLCGVC